VQPEHAPLGGRTETPIAIGGISVPDSKLAREMAEFVRDTESLLLFHHSSRVYYWGALTGKRWGLRFAYATSSGAVRRGNLLENAHLAQTFFRGQEDRDERDLRSVYHATDGIAPRRVWSEVLPERELDGGDTIPSSFMPAPCSTTWVLPLSARANMSASK
jgi:hypothetical protein